MRRTYDWSDRFRPYLADQSLAGWGLIDALIDSAAWLADDLYEIAFPASDPRWPRRDFGVAPDWCGLGASDIAGLCSELKSAARDYGLDACRALPKYPAIFSLADGRSAVMIGVRSSPSIDQRSNHAHGAMVSAGAVALTTGWLSRAEASAWRIENEAQ